MLSVDSPPGNALGQGHSLSPEATHVQWLVSVLRGRCALEGQPSHSTSGAVAGSL